MDHFIVFLLPQNGSPNAIILVKQKPNKYEAFISFIQLVQPFIQSKWTHSTVTETVNSW